MPPRRAKAPVDFGTVGFSRSGAAATKTGTPVITVTSCADAAEQVSVRGTDATGGATTWALSDQADDPCSLGINVFGLALGDLRLGRAARPWAMLAPAGSAVATARLTMPCSGSGGSGQTLTARLVFTATAV